MHVHHQAGLLACASALILLGPTTPVPPAHADTTSYGSGAATAGTARAERPHPRRKGPVVVRFSGPADVPARLRITGRHVKVTVARPETGRRVRLRLPVGRYDVGARPTTLGDQYYAAELSRTSIKVSRGRRTAVELTMAPGPRADVALVSVSDDGGQSDGFASGAVVSGDGRYVAFETPGSSLVPGDTNDTYDVFLRDLEAGTTVRVSDGMDGAGGNGVSVAPSISDDGRYVTFISGADNLVVADANLQADVFVWDRTTGTTVRAGMPAGGGEPNGSVQSASISGDGRHVAFTSGADNLVARDTNRKRDVFVWDRETDATTRINLSADGRQANRLSFDPSISDDGAVVAYQSRASNLAPGDRADRRDDIFVWDRATGSTTWESRSRSGKQPDDSSVAPSLSGDGRFLSFVSYADNLVPGRRDGRAEDVFVRDLRTGGLRRLPLPVSRSTYAAADDASLSSDGRFVLYSLYASDENRQSAVVYDRTSGEHDRVTYSTTGAPVDVRDLTFSDDARVVVALAYDDAVVPGDTNEERDVFAWGRP